MLSTVYAIRVEDQNYFKIGYTDYIEQRLMALQTGNPFQLIVYRQIETMFPREVERIIHAYLAGSGMQGEWFFVEPHVIDAAFGIPSPGRFTLKRVGELPNSYAISPTSWSVDSAGETAFIGSLCVTPGEVEAECVALMQSLMGILSKARALDRGNTNS